MSKSVSSNKSVSRSTSENMNSVDKNSKKKDDSKNKVRQEVPVKSSETSKKSVKREVPPSVQAAPVEQKSKSSTKGSTKDKTAAPPPETVVPSVPETESTEQKTKKKRREVNVQSVETEFDSVLDVLRETVDASRTDKKKVNVAKVLRQLSKRLKVLKVDCLRISKHRRTNRPKNTSSGFMKPVKVSGDLAKFANWDPTQLRSRIDATTYICQYIKQNNLQDPNDRRRVVPDDKLSKLLDYDPKKEVKPLTYCYIQNKIQKHFNSSS